MNWKQIKNNWDAVRDKIRCTWGKQSDSELRAVAGHDQLAIMLQRRYGYATVVAENKVDLFVQELNR